MGTSNGQRSSPIFFAFLLLRTKLQCQSWFFKQNTPFSRNMAGCCNVFQRWLSLFLYFFGLTISAYSYYVSMAKKADENYVALCDIDEKISCSKVFTSKYGKGFGLVELITGDETHPMNQPNSLYGIIFYALFGMLYLCSGSSNFLANLQFYSFILANVMSCYLGYILYFVLEDLCVLCLSTYVVNFMLLLLSYCKKRSLRKKSSSIMDSYSTRNEPTLPSFGSRDAFKKNI